jgi:hypothetical protein
MCGEVVFLASLVIAHRARTLFAKIGEIVVAAMTVRPADVHPCSGRNMDFDVVGFPAWIDWDWHFFL